MNFYVVIQIFLLITFMLQKIILIITSVVWSKIKTSQLLKVIKIPACFYGTAKTHKYETLEDITVANLKFPPIIDQTGTFMSDAEKVISDCLINSPYEIKYRWNEYDNNLKYQWKLFVVTHRQYYNKWFTYTKIKQMVKILNISLITVKSYKILMWHRHEITKAF